MSDENQTDPQEQEHVPAPAETPSATKTFTQEEVEALISKRLARKEKQTEAQIAELQAKLDRAKPKSKPKAQPNNDEPPEWVGEIRQELDSLKQERAKAAADKAFREQVGDRQLDPEAADLIRLKFNPEDPGAIEPLIEKFKSQPTQATYNSPGAPSATGPEPVTNPVHWSPDTIARLKSQGKLKAEFEKYFANQGKPRIFGAPSRKG